MSQICEYDILMINYQSALIKQEAAEADLFKSLGGVIDRDGNMWAAKIPNSGDGPYLCIAFCPTRLQAIEECLHSFRFEKLSKIEKKANPTQD